MPHLPRALPLLALICLSLILVPVLSERHTHECKHDNVTLPKVKVPVPHAKESDGRLLSTYSAIRVVFDTSNLDSQSSDTITYIQTYLLPAAKNYIEATLKVIPISGTLSFAESDVEECGMSLASQYYDTGAGVDADLVIAVTASSETDEEYVAYAGACLLDDSNNRPILGLLNFNLAYVAATTNNVTIQDNLLVTIHEMTHVLGFSSGLFEYYVDPTNNNSLLTNVTTNLTVNGWTQTAVITSTVKAYVQDYFDCSTAVGAYLENQGGDMSSNSHWERRIFNNEYMTASAINDLRLSKLTLSLLQDSGWYEVDFSMADNITYGAGEGCDFLNTPCVDSSTKTVSFDEFCTLGAMGCNWAGTGKSYCSYSTSSSSLASYENYWGNNTETWDEFADNCPTFAVYSNGDCEDATLIDDAILADAESFEYGAKCFMGTLYTYPQSLTQKYPYCFKPTCVRDNSGSYVVEVKIGSTTANCTASGQISVSGYGGYLVCPDPDTFCATVMAEDNCRGNCYGRGTCVSNTTCECDDGWTYIDCSRKEYIDNYATCTSDTWKTTLYGDDCVCNPSNNTCACNNGIKSADSCCDAGLSSYCKSKTGVIVGAVVGSVGGVIVIAVIIIVWKKMAAAKAAKLAARAAGSHQPVALNSPSANAASYPPTMQSPQAYAPQADPNMMQAGYNQAPVMQGQPQYPVMQGQAPQSVNVRPANYQY